MTGHADNRRRLAMLRVTAELLMAFLRGECREADVQGIPADAEIVDADFSAPYGQAIFLLRSAHFRELSDGEYPPDLSPSVTHRPDPRPLELMHPSRN